MTFPREPRPDSRAGDIAEGDTVELEITNVAHGGVFVARHLGRVVFVSDTVPGERVLARISDTTHDTFWRADTVEVLEASVHRRPHLWAEASVDRSPEQRPGGAEFGHIQPGHQRELKRVVLTEALSRMAGHESDVSVEALPEHSDAGWRTRVRLHVDDDGRVGPYAARSHQVVAVDSLPLAVDALAEIAPLGLNLPDVSTIDLVATSTGQTHVLTTPRSERRASPRGSRADQRRRGGPARRPASGAAPAAQTIVETVGNREFQLDVRGFWQVHAGAATRLSQAVVEGLDRDLFDPQADNLDLYGGVGLLAAAVGDFAASPGLRITTVESDARATGHAKHNLREWGAQAVTARVDSYLDYLGEESNQNERARLSAGTVILDPPRAGAGKKVVRALGRLQPAQILYVACDPVALARDVALLAAEGYRLRSLSAFDLFPNTHHLESVARLTR
ncbi:class I SAM-dependent RNA methyltransferase [Homoserinimonas sp. OAct 916]|uniref:class I SAM-dependent RNA methyltransferase n=1 Tax=Homoserinimonas sp. OAct 916 TaxID=2211450 RepID=UPI001E627A04|nr:TRAM domain-containing protein [Homoserinimonas sp. OAct 916]